jgi:hypothetical protein
VGEAIIIEGPEGMPPRRLYIVSVDGNTVRLAIDAPDDIKITREELLPLEARRRWWEDRGSKFSKVAAILCTSLALDKVQLFLM